MPWNQKAAWKWLGKNRPPMTKAHNKPAHEQWANAVAEVVRRERRLPDPFDGPCILQAIAVFKRPGRLNRKKDPDGLLPMDRTPDGDNASLKIVADALTRANLYTDDARIVDWHGHKRYAEKGGQPRVEIILETFYPHEPPQMGLINTLK